MRGLIIAAALAALALPAAVAPTDALAASCSSRKATGTVLGGVGGALLGSAVSNGAAGTIVGGLGGAFAGREIGKSGCRYRTTSSTRTRTVYRDRAPARAYAPARAPEPVRARTVYYDQYGRPISTANTSYR